MTKKKTLTNNIRSSVQGGLAAALIALSFFSASHASAQDMKPYPRVKLQSLDKATARTMTFEADVGSTLKFGPLYMRVQECKKSSPIEEPESAAFLQIWEVDIQDKPHWVFSGWMFASSPALSPMDHPIYDVWVIDCLPPKSESTEKSEPEENSKSDQKNAESAETSQDGEVKGPVETPSQTPEEQERTQGDLLEQ